MEGVDKDIEAHGINYRNVIPGDFYCDVRPYLLHGPGVFDVQLLWTCQVCAVSFINLRVEWSSNGVMDQSFSSQKCRNDLNVTISWFQLNYRFSSNWSARLVEKSASEVQNSGIAIIRAPKFVFSFVKRFFFQIWCLKTRGALHSSNARMLFRVYELHVQSLFYFVFLRI